MERFFIAKDDGRAIRTIVWHLAALVLDRLG